MDYSLFTVLNGLAGRSKLLDAFMIAVATYSPIVYALALVWLWLTWKNRNQRAALIAAISALIALGVGQIVGRAFPRDRPFLTHKVSLLISHSPDSSFPSDHTTLAFAIAMALWCFNHRAGTVLAIFGVLTAIARVFVGAHYPGDVLGGALVGALTSVLVVSLSKIPFVKGVIDRLFHALEHVRLAARNS